MENQAIENTSENKLVIPYDKDRKNLTFYDTYVDMNGDVVKYDDIAVFQSAAFNNSSMIYIYFSKSFNYNFTLTTYDGNKHVFKRSGYSAYGIGTYKRIYNEYSEVAAFVKTACGLTCKCCRCRNYGGGDDCYGFSDG